METFIYRALEKLTEGEAHKVISTVPNENGFEAWRQLTMRFEPELEAQKNTVLLELHSIPVSTSVDETKTKLVELKVRTARTQDILGEKITDMQKKPPYCRYWIRQQSSTPPMSWEVPSSISSTQLS